VQQTLKPGLKPGDLRAEVRRVQKAIAPGAAVVFTGRVVVKTVKYPTGFQQKHYVLPLTVNGKAMHARYEVGVGETSTLRFYEGDPW
jgi:hypothetical protein